ncbi:hypothetical protein [Arenimonas composti]|uniref:hypothetical protein n=1 Tax=Arenimonas composti TaxID=370776 RepID=UPI00047E20C1|nr:hypothetical protein [Arenimonas composti]
MRRTPRGSLILPLPFALFPSLPETLALPEGRFSRKDELHLTVLSQREATAVAEALPVSAWPARLAAHDWRVTPTARRFLLRDQEDGRIVHTVIAEVVCAALNACRRDFAEASGAGLPDTLPHVTLFVDGTAKGIGLVSIGDFTAKCVRVVDPAGTRSISR